MLQSLFTQHSPARGGRWTLVLVVAIALLTAQALGLQHRIEHRAPTGWTHAGGHALAQAAALANATDCDHDALPPSGATHHSCAALDALALGDGPPGAVAQPPAAPPSPTRVVERRAPCSPHDVRLAFEARGPPATFS
jgi:hypothetical protein